MTLWLTPSLPFVAIVDTVPYPPSKSVTYNLNGLLEKKDFACRNKDIFCHEQVGTNMVVQNDEKR